MKSLKFLIGLAILTLSLQVSVEVLAGTNIALTKVVTDTKKAGTAITGKLTRKNDPVIASTAAATDTPPAAAGAPAGSGTPPAGGETAAAGAKQPITSVYATLFTDPDRTINVCDEAKSEEDISQNELIASDLGSFSQNVPRTKINYNEQKKNRKWTISLHV